jgi:hypothetical protein
MNNIWLKKKSVFRIGLAFKNKQIEPLFNFRLLMKTGFRVGWLKCLLKLKEAPYEVYEKKCLQNLIISSFAEMCMILVF